MRRRNREQELQRRVDQLELLLTATQERLNLYESVNDLAVGFVSGQVISEAEARPILIRSQFHSKDIVLAIYLQQETEIRQNERYIFAGELDGHFHTRCKTHHMNLRAEQVYRAIPQLSAGLPSRDLIEMWLFSKIIGMYRT